MQLLAFRLIVRIVILDSYQLRVASPMRDLVAKHSNSVNKQFLWTALIFILASGSHAQYRCIIHVSNCGLCGVILEGFARPVLIDIGQKPAEKPAGQLALSWPLPCICAKGWTWIFITVMTF